MCGEQISSEEQKVSVCLFVWFAFALILIWEDQDREPEAMKWQCNGSDLDGSDMEIFYG